MVRSRELSLDEAHNLIASLEKQLEELEATSHDYEQELEGFIQKLQTDLNDKDETIKSLKRGDEHKEARERITALEIQTDELEEENRVLRSQFRTFKGENDRLMELNVLLEHEVADLRSTSQSIRRRDSDNCSKTSFDHENESLRISPKKKRQSNPVDFLRVRTDQSSLRLSSSYNAATDLRATHVSTAKVVASTRHK
ncbi:Ndl1p LALA0_S03e08812g [Lachancea lanzarotensis]|uniref:LALA0S03e08812g1_1 n=1 Tax=Lachancea lanzarotensis TaxID=1245769 RepID=A0A0C7MP86_9SACH|nr:uncharacterized protein LALA0_S03e08812g [Lachancea lanzarotensis]CEP61697.1 LALA0S03e08812g1_1 [Lachancea lanzarotensis]